ncbi:MAG: multidrug efflux SMR transporter [Pirellulales bacterium]
MGPWWLLILAGCLETAWAVGLKYTDGFTRLWPSLWTAAAIAGSMILLALAARSIPIGTAYSVWVGIGAVGACILGRVLFDEPLTLLRLLFLALLLVAIAGLKLTSQEPA